MTPEQQARVLQWRSRASIPEGQPNALTREEMIQIVALLRGGRTAAVASSEAARRTKAAAAIPDADGMIDELMGGM